MKQKNEKKKNPFWSFVQRSVFVLVVLIAMLGVAAYFHGYSEMILCPSGMTFVPGGQVQLVFEGEKWGGNAVETRTIKPFCMDKYEASRLHATLTEPGEWMWFGQISPAHSIKDVLPWVDASFSQAKQACENSGKRLPNLAEWQMAFSGPNGDRWPQGLEMKNSECWINKSTDQVFPTGGCCFPVEGNSTRSTTCDMIGNLSEWIDEYWDENCYKETQMMIAGGAAHSPWMSKNSQMEDPEKTGCWKFKSYGSSRAALHHHGLEEGHSDDGFRCAKDIPSFLRFLVP